MIFSQDIGTDDVIVEVLSVGEMTVKDLHKQVTERRQVSLKSVYNALHQLISTGVVYKMGVNVGLSREWAKEVEERLAGRPQAPELADGQSVTYTFSSIGDSDRYWKHLTLLIRGVDPHYPVFFLFPNEMWVHLKERGESEKQYLRDFEVNKQYAYLTLGGNTALDQAFRKEHMNDYLQIEPVPNAVKHLNVYTTIIGDYIIRTHLPRQTAEQIATLYKNDMDENKFEEKL